MQPEDLTDQVQDLDKPAPPEPAATRIVLSAQARRILGLVGLLVVVIVAVCLWAPSELKVYCRAAGALVGGHRCTFQNDATILPGRQCARVTVRDRASGRSTSTKACSGYVWGGSTKEVPLLFDPDPFEVCEMLDEASCELSVVAE